MSKINDTDDEINNADLFPRDWAIESGFFLSGYLKFRAEREGVECALTPEFFADAIQAGCRKFFGIALCECGCGRPVCDEQQPKLFAEFNELYGRDRALWRDRA